MDLQDGHFDRRAKWLMVISIDIDGLTKKVPSIDLQDGRFDMKNGTWDSFR